MGVADLKDRAAVVGVGNSKIDRDEGTDLMGLLGVALKEAVADCGLRREEIDGLIVNWVHDQAAMDKAPQMLGLENIRYAFQTWQHGRMSAPAIGLAALVVNASLASHVACISLGFSVGDFREMQAGGDVGESDREGYGAHLEFPPYGMVGPHGGAALAMQKYLLKYGYTSQDLGAVAVSMRQWACLNPNACYYDKPITIEDYLACPFVVEPLRVYDCSVPANGAFCIIVTTSERAKDLKKKPIYISGIQGAHTGRQNFIFSRNGLGVGQQDEFEYKPPEMTVYRMAGVTQEDIDLLYQLDSFSPCVIFGLELFGFCRDGEALGWIQGGRTGPGGELPINTNGGGLSEIHSMGWGHMVEAVRQLRGECGPRQVEGAELAQYLSQDGASIVFRR